MPSVVGWQIHQCEFVRIVGVFPLPETIEILPGATVATVDIVPGPGGIAHFAPVAASVNESRLHDAVRFAISVGWRLIRR